MERISKIAFYLAGAVFFLCASLSAYQVRELTLDARQGLSGLMVEIDATLQRVSATADVTQQAAEEQRLYWQRNSKQVGKVLTEQEAAARSLRLAIENTDKRLNGEILPQLAEAIRMNDARAGVLADEAQITLTKLDMLLEEHTALATSLKARADDPAIAQAAKNVEQLTANAEQTRQRVDELLIELRKVAKTGRLTLLLQGLSAVAGVFH